jgi:hypothetical protein
LPNLIRPAQTVKTIDLIKAEMVKGFKSQLLGVQPMLARSMCAAYEQGLTDAIDWAKAYNEKHRDEWEKKNGSHERST